jgi:hypothetical protein
MKQLYTIIEVGETAKWRKALANIPHSFAHTSEHCRALQLSTGYRTFLYLFEKDDVKICCPLVEREFRGIKDIAKPFGVSGFVGNGKHPDFYNTWLEFVNSRGYLTCYSEIHPLFGQRSWFPEENVFSQGMIQILDISPDTDTILTKMSKKRRKQFRNWESTLKSLTVNRGDIQSFFIAHYDDFLDRKEADSYYYLSQEAIKAFFQAENSVVVGAAEDGKLIAASYFGYTEYLSDALFTLSLPGKNHYSAELIWYAVLELKQQGVPLLNMGGGDGGIAEFKRRFGAYKTDRFSLKEIYDTSEYRRITRQNSIGLNNKKGFFPAYRIKQV